MAVASTTIMLATGDNDISDAFDLNDGINTFVVPSSLKLPPPFIRTFRSRHLGTTQTTDPFRTITMQIDVLATDEAALIAGYVRPIEVKLAQAEANSGSTPEDGRGTVLWLAMGLDAGLSYFDVDSGSLDWIRDDAKTGATPAWTLTLELKCKPYARDHQTTYTFGTLTIGTGAVCYIANLAGDAPGLLQGIFTDVSTGGVAIDRYRIGVYSLEGLGSSDYVPWIAATPYGVGQPFADVTALNGVNAARLTLNGMYQNLAMVRQPANAIREQGKFDAWLLCRDSSPVLYPPSNLATVLVGGSTFAGLFGNSSQSTFVVTALDGSGNETQASMPITIAAYTGNTPWTFSWSNVGLGSPVSYRLYGYNMPNSSSGTTSAALWYYRTIAGGATTYTTSAGTPFNGNGAGLTAANPPTSGSQQTQGAVIQPYIGVIGSGNQPTALVAANAVQTALGNSNWELVPLGMYPLPTVSLFEGRAGVSLPWCITFAAGYLATGTPTLDIAGVLILKHESPSNETRLGPAGNGTQVITTIDTNRREQVGAVVQSQYQAPSRTGLVAEYLMNQGSGTSLTDTSASGNTGTLQSGTGWALDAAIAGVSGSSNCLTVAGGNGVSIATLTGIPTGNAAYSIVALINPTAMGGRPVEWGANTANNTSGLFLTATGYSSAFWSADLVVTNGYIAGGWHVLATTYDGTTRKLYLDGVLVASDTPAAHAATAANFNLGFQLTGKLGPVRIYSRAMTAAELAAYQGMLPGYVGPATSIGKLLAGPGNALIVIDADVANYVHDTTNAKVQPTFLHTPRYKNLRGDVL